MIDRDYIGWKAYYYRIFVSFDKQEPYLFVQGADYFEMLKIFYEFCHKQIKERKKIVEVILYEIATNMDTETVKKKIIEFTRIENGKCHLKNCEINYAKEQ